MKDRKEREVTIGQDDQYVVAVVHPDMLYGPDLIEPLIDLLVK